MQLENKKIVISGGFVKIASVEQEWEEDLENPAEFVDKVKAVGLNADLFTFWQRVPNTEPQYAYHMEWDNMALIPIKDFKYWWEKQTDATARNKIRKAEKKGVIIKEVDYTDHFVRGIMDIYNESPVRQGKPFWHYGKDFETVKKMNGMYLDKSHFIGAYFNDELIGFIKLIYGNNSARTVQILSKVEHRDKAPTNGLVAKAVEICAHKNIGYFIYDRWADSSLGDFKRNNGFQKIELPRYYIPLNTKGAIALKLGLHHGVAEILPDSLKSRLKHLRTQWYERKTKSRFRVSALQ
jgi:hypothetical protein